MAMEKMVRVSSKGQIVLPKRIRDKMGIREGDYIFVQESEDGNAILSRAGESQIDSIFKGFRQAAKEMNFTREDLEAAIREVRGKKAEE